MPIRAVELGMTVHVPAYAQDGVVQAMMPGAAVPVFLVELALSGRSVWLELADMEEPLRIVGDTAPLATSPAMHRNSSGGKGGRPSPQQTYRPSSPVRAGSASLGRGLSGSPLAAGRHADVFAAWQREQTRSERSQPTGGGAVAPLRFGSWQTMTSMLED